MAFNLALLSDDTPEELALSDDANDAVVAEIAEGPDADLAAMGDVSGDLDDASATIEEGADTADTLEAVAEQVDLANKDGGLSAPAAEALRLCIEHMSARVGIAAPRSLAAEGFASKSSRVRSGQLAAEDIKDTAKQIWDWILKAYEKVKAWVIKWFNNFFDGATKVKNRAEKLAKAAEAKSGYSVDSKDSKISNPAYAVHLSRFGKPADGKYIAEAIKIMDKSDEKFPIEESVTEMHEVAAELVGLVEDKARFDSEIKNGLKTFSGLPEEAIKGFKAPEGMKTSVMYRPPIGDTVVVAIIPKDLTTDNIGKIKLTTKSEGSTSGTFNMDMEATAPDVVKEIATTTKGAAETLIELKKDFAKLEQSFKGVQASLNRTKKNYEGDAAARVKTVSQFMKVTLAFTTGGMVQVRVSNLQVLNAALSYGAASLNLAKSA